VITGIETNQSYNIRFIAFDQDQITHNQWMGDNGLGVLDRPNAITISNQNDLRFQFTNKRSIDHSLSPFKRSNSPFMPQELTSSTHFQRNR
jgi:hypothetical protein